MMTGRWREGEKERKGDGEKYIFGRPFIFSSPRLPVSPSPLLALLFIALTLSGCSEIRAPKPAVYISEAAPPRKQEFRWSNGKMPKTFDPARAAASPETDIVRALYEGLTDLDARSLKPVPAIAAKFTASEDFKTWTFQLRTDAKWSNGQPVTAADFVRSWKRLAEMGGRVSQRDLLKNIVGMDTENALPVFASQDETIFQNGLENPLPDVRAANEETNANANVNASLKPEPKPKGTVKKPEPKPERIKVNEMDFGVEAVNSHLLKVTLKQPDENFPTLVAHPMFRPIYGESKEIEATDLSVNIVTNGAFRPVSVVNDGITLERADNYWNKAEVGLERVKFVQTESAESALAAYRRGEIDVVTNANFAPLALKLLKPYDELRRTKHGALNFYEFNLNQKPFDDRRVREALAVAIERERLTEDEMDGTTEPALSFLPFENEARLAEDLEQAKKLLTEAGYPNGAGFPTIRLVVNRNDLQKRIARSVAKMWKKTLNVETEVIIKDAAEFQSVLQNGEFDVVRRGIVLPTADETANMMAMFEPKIVPQQAKTKSPPVTPKPPANNQILTDKTAESNLNLQTEPESSPEEKSEAGAPTAEMTGSELILTEEQALDFLPAIPLYFPTSYALVKPYVQGFDTNALDAPSLKNVKIDSNWQPSNQKILSNGQN